MKLVIIPGLSNSGPDHWQTYWEKKYPDCIRVLQRDWDNPLLPDWLTSLNAVASSLTQPAILVAHSLGVALVAHWAQKNANPWIHGALLVSPSDVDSIDHTPEVVRSFAPMPLDRIPFRSVVVASENDPYVSIERAAFFAKQWGSELVNVGRYGHINSDSKLQNWEFGQEILRQLEAGQPLDTARGLP